MSSPAQQKGFKQQDRRLRGSLEGNPEPGDRLRFVFVFVSFVACVRAGEAKLRVRARFRVFLLGRPWLWEVLLLLSRPLCEAQDVVYTWVLRPNGSKSVPGSRSLPLFYVGFMKVLHQTRVYGMGLMANPLQTHVWCISCKKNLIKIVSSTASEGKSSATPW